MSRQQPDFPFFSPNFSGSFSASLSLGPAAAAEQLLRQHEQKRRLRFTLADRLAQAVGSQLRFTLADGQVGHLRLERVGQGWISGRSGNRQAVIVTAALAALSSPSGPAPPSSALRLDVPLPRVLRTLAQLRPRCRVNMSTGLLVGSLLNVYRDFLELLVEPRRPPLVVPLRSLLMLDTDVIKTGAIKAGKIHSGGI